jgi:lipid-A-disaccharide synthase
MMLAKTLLKNFQPDLLILIDFPGFNLPVSAIAKRYRVRVLYYISPQIWAWAQGRVKKIRKRVDHMAVILPFEAAFYRNHGVPVTFVGHPLMDAYGRNDKERITSGKDDRVTIGLLPGSRRREISHLFPVMLKAASMISERLENVYFAISQAASVDRTAMAALIRKHAPDIDCELVPDGADRVFNKCAVSVVTSGTVTLEAAICGVPMVIIYKVAPISALLAWFFLRVDHIGLVNLIAGKRLVPELIQFDASPKKITDAVCNMIGNRPGLEVMRQELSRVKDALGSPGASKRTAEIALNML